MCCIISDISAKNTNKGECINILKRIAINNIRGISKIFAIIIIGTIIMTASILLKYKVAYEVKIAGKTIGYIKNKGNFEKEIEEKIIKQNGKNIENVSLIQEPVYNVKLILRNTSLNDAEIIEEIKQKNTRITYKYYEISLNSETKEKVDTIEEAEEIVNKIKSEFDGDELELILEINEKYSTNIQEVNTDSLEIASNNIQNIAQEIKDKKEEDDAIAIINGVKLSYLPVSGKITSRFGESSRLRKSTHTGLDIACSTGTDIKAVSSGTVIFAQYNGSYGNLIKIDHGNGVETWYAHCSKLYAKVGQKINAGDIIAAVGSTGNSTGSHLHLEIRIDGNAINPQNYVY